MADDRQDEYQHVLDMMRDLNAAGIGLYKLALLCGRPYNTVKHWAGTGRVESFDLKILERLHRNYAATTCLLSPESTQNQGK